jgi:hypothetical protein
MQGNRLLPQPNDSAFVLPYLTPSGFFKMRGVEQEAQLLNRAGAFHDPLDRAHEGGAICGPCPVVAHIPDGLSGSGKTRNVEGFLHQAQARAAGIDRLGENLLSTAGQAELDQLAYARLVIRDGGQKGTEHPVRRRK